ncbi:response regulator transcription factor [Leucobacter insecticola]|uniref:Response regulator transcription factor n=1 Tax=Leucobacter insecticola TaxID=2714934 RepID=A0A6G8FFT5_9MICO|nr:LuxR C-terminal-related transcriptional regulator [Leucobacter insecticola]QIM15208.1 response regulator transcription factor [Leucobacter insecticola]
MIFAITSARSTAEVQRLIDEVARLRLPGGVMRRIYQDWGRARIAAITGELEEAAQACWTSALTLHQHGVVATAILSGARSLDLCFDEERLRVMESWVATVQSDFLTAYFDFVVARESADVEALIALLPRLGRTGRVEQTVRACEEVVRLLRRAGEDERASSFEHEGAMFIESLEPGVHETGHSESVVTRLTDREREVAELLVQGLTSQEIHRHLSISVRTVENHVHNIKSKLGVSKRGEAIEWLRIGLTAGDISLP